MKNKRKDYCIEILIVFSYIFLTLNYFIICFVLKTARPVGSIYFVPNHKVSGKFGGTSRNPIYARIVKQRKSCGIAK
jgi:hypothetical protein